MNIPELQDQKNFLGRWSKFFIERHRIVYLIILMILVWGISSFIQLPRENQPEVVIPYGIVSTQYNGASPKEMEALITDKIEAALDDIEEVKTLKSNSSYSSSIVFAEFEMDADMDKMLNKMRSKISDITNDLPDGASTPIVSDLATNNTPIMIMNISGNYDLAQLKTYAKDIKKELQQIHNVGDIEIIGGVEREIQIQVDPLKLATYNLSLADIERTISSAHLNYPGGSLELDKKNYNIRTVGEYKTVAALRSIPLKNHNNIPLTIGDIALIKDDFQSEDAYSRLSQGLSTDNPRMENSVSLSIKKKDDGDITEVSKLIHEKIDDGGFYPKDLTLNISGDMAKYVEDQLGAVINNSKAGLFLVIIVLFLFIGFWESIIVSFVIPLSILISLGIMQATNITLNTISLFSLILAIGMLVDNGIVIMENVDRLRLSGLNSKLAAETGTNQIAPAILASTLTTIAAFFPIALTPGIMGQYIRQIPLTVIFTLIASFFVAVTITPTLSAKMLKDHKKLNKLKVKKNNVLKYIPVVFVFGLALYAFIDYDTGIGTLSWVFAIVFSIAMILKIKFSNPAMEKDHFIIRRYGKFLESIIKSKKKKLLVIGCSLLIFILSLSMIPLGILKVQMFTAEDYDRLYINIETPKGSTLDQTTDITETVEKHLFTKKSIDSFVSNIGKTGADSFDQFAIRHGAIPNQAQIIIDLKEKKNRSISSMQLAEELRTFVKDIPGAEIEVEELQDGPPQASPVHIRIQGNDLKTLKHVAKDFTAILESIDGTKKVENNVEKGYPELQVIVNKTKAANYSLSEYDIAKQIRENVYGIEASTFRQGQEEYDIIVKLSDKEFKTKKDLEKIQFINRKGEVVRFTQVANLHEAESFTSIIHEDQKRQVSVTSKLANGFTSTEVIDKFKTEVANYPLPQQTSFVFGGEAEEINENYTQMFMNMIIAAILVFLILAVQFNSLSQPFIILLTIPLALIGVIFGLIITGNQFTFVAFVGVVALVGIAVNDAIVLVDYINYLRKNGYSLNDAIKKTGKTRFIPVMATTITTAGGILPITLKQPFFSPLGYSIIFGLCTATVLTLVIIPIMYSLMTDFKTFIYSKFREEKV